MKRKKLSLHVNRKDAAREPRSPQPLVIPVVQVSDAPSGLLEIKVRDSQGNRMGFFQIAAAEVDDQLLEDLHDWQARHSHDRPELVVKS